MDDIDDEILTALLLSLAVRWF